MTDCLITGVGGQGTILAARLIGNAALIAGLDARGSETIGMAQRGGSVTSHVRIGEGAFSQMIRRGSADAILGFEPCEAARAVGYLKPDGVMIICDKPIQPFSPGGTSGYDAEEILKFLTSSVKRLRVLSGKLIEEKCGARSLNVAMIGAALALNVFPFSASDMEQAIDAVLGAKLAEANKKALEIGASLRNQ